MQLIVFSVISAFSAVDCLFFACGLAALRSQPFPYPCFHPGDDL